MYFGLFWTSFLAATIIPLSSEAGLVAALFLGYDPFLCILVASIGNCAGATLNYVGGRKGVSWIVQKLFKFDEVRIEKYTARYNKYQLLFLLLSWAPIVGDPITVYLGVVKTPYYKFALYVYGTRVLRYVVTYLVFKWAVL